METKQFMELAEIIKSIKETTGHNPKCKEFTLPKGGFLVRLEITLDQEKHTEE